MEIKKANLVFRNKQKRSRTDLIVLHHAAGNGPIENIHNYHKNNLGWSGVGYNFYVRKDGTIWEGRGLEYIGAHSTNNNSTSIGICAEGNFEHDIMSNAQKDALVWLVAYCLKEYPNCAIKGHRNLQATACPGRNYPLDDIVNRAKALATGSISITPTKPEPAPTPAPSPVQTIINEDDYVVLKRGVTKAQYGTQIKLLQFLLILNGFDCGRWGADGSFGGATDAALRSFQRARGLTIDGVCGNNTWRELLKVVKVA